MVELKKFISIQVLLWIIVTSSGIYTIINAFQSYTAQTQLTTQRAISLYIRENPLVEEPKVYGNNITIINVSLMTKTPHSMRGFLFDAVYWLLSGALVKQTGY